MNSRKPVGCGDVDMQTLERIAPVLRLLAHPHRLRIVDILRDGEGLPVHAIAARLGLPPAATSQHLNHMRRAGLVAATRHAREVRYHVAEKRALAVLDCICGRSKK